MQIEKFCPSTRLEAFVKEFLIIESDVEVANTILPDTSMVMALRLKGKVLAANIESIPAAVITGLRNSARTLHNARSTGNLLVILREGGFSGVFQPTVVPVLGNT